LLRDCRDITENDASERIRDASLIAAAQFIQHNEIVRYTVAYRWAQGLKHEAALSLLEATPDEEASASASLECLAAVVNESVLLARQT
jgi:ferritin-like metal-binding protein YciE